MSTQSPFESYLSSMFIQSGSHNTLNSYRTALNHFESFVKKQQHKSILTLIAEIKTDKQDPFKTLNEFIIYLHNLELKPKSIKLMITATKGFLRSSGVKIYNEDFKQLVKLPKILRHREEPLTKEILLRLLRNISTKLQTVVLVALSSGMRISEISQLRISDLDFESTPTLIRIRAEITKTKESRETFLTTEATNALKDYLSRFYSWKEGSPNPNIKEQLIFGPTTKPRKSKEKKTHTTVQITTSVLRCSLLYSIRKISELNQLNENGIHMIHFHAFRKFFRTVVGNAVGRDFAEALMGHHFYLDSYYNLPEEERKKMYLKAEPYLTISDFRKVEKDLISIKMKQDEIEEKQIELIQALKCDHILLPKILEKLIK